MGVRGMKENSGQNSGPLLINAAYHTVMILYEDNAILRRVDIDDS